MPARRNAIGLFIFCWHLYHPAGLFALTIAYFVVDATRFLCYILSVIHPIIPNFRRFYHGTNAKPQFLC